MNATAKKASAATDGYVKVTYTSHLRQGPGTQYGTSRYLTPGESYKYVETRSAEGYTWYRVSTSEWVASAGVTAYTPGTSTPATGNGSQTTGWLAVNTPANLRQGPGLAYGVARTLAANEVYKYFATQQADGFTWYLVGNNQWVASAGVTAYTGQYPGNASGTPSSPSNGTGSSPTAQSGTLRVTYDANLHQGPGTNYAVSRALSAGGTYQYFAVQQANGYTWYQVSTNEWIADVAVTTGSTTNPATDGNNNSNGSTTGNTTPANQTKVAAVLSLARQQLGKPYVWGGKGPDVFDCSGLMYYIFLNAAGVNIGGWTVPQESSGRSVSLNALQPGDIIFWGPQGNTYHDALYIGNNQYIAAPEPGDVVRIQTISSGFAPSMAVRVL